MVRYFLKTAAACAIAGMAASCSAADSGQDEGAVISQSAACSSSGLALQVLGSGGPIAESGRAGTSYLLWIDGEARLLIDIGSGAFLRFAEAGADFNTLDAILLTHLHADHAGDLAGVLKYGGFTPRTRALPVIGPDAAPRFPATDEFLDALLGKDGGAFAYLGGYIDGSEDKVLLEPRAITTAMGKGDPVEIELADDLRIRAIPVHHGVVPALGFEISVGDRKLVITGDQSANSAAFEQALAGSKPDILFAHHVINGDRGQPRGLHRTPAQIGELAAALQPGRLVLTHNMNRALERIDDSRAAIAQNYAGEVTVADDLDCFGL